MSAVEVTGGEGPDLRVVIYTRISTDEQNQPHSLAVQEKDCRAFCAKRASWKVAEVLVDEMSGAKIERPGLQKLLAMARDGEFEVLLVHKLDRLSRDPMIHHTVLGELAASGIRIVSSAENFDLDSSAGRLMAGVMNLVASYERESIIDRIRRANAEKASRGRWVGGSPPFGFRKDADHVLVEDPHEAAVVRRVFHLYVTEGLGAASIRNKLETEGHRTRRRGLWTSQAILGLLKNPAYVGKIRRLGEIHDGLHEPLVDPETWDQAQERLRERGGPRPSAPDDSTYLLTGVLRCGLCGGAYVGTAANNQRGTRYRYYACVRRVKAGRSACDSQRVRADYLEPAVIDSIIETYESTGIFQDAIDRAAANEPHRIACARAELSAVQAAVARASRAISKYFADFEDDRVSREVAWPRIEALTLERQQLEHRCAELQGEIANAHPGLPSPTDLTRVGELIRDAFACSAAALLRELLSVLVAEIRIESDGQILPVLRVPGRRTN